MTEADPIPRLNAALEGRYHIERELGAGGMATVYLARDGKHERDVAIKVLRPELAAALGTERFLKEIKLTANLQHPSILPLFDSGEADGFLYYVMPFVRGETLRALMDREGRLETETALEIAGEVALALDYAHRAGVVHRDIKPENVLLHEGRPLVADFGIALAVEEASGDRLTGTGLSLGTPTYMSPEQARGDRQIDERADVYSLGCILYEMLVGDPPHTGSNPQTVVARILTQEPAPVSTLRPTVPAHVDAAVSRALAKTPADRWKTASAFSEALSTPGPAVSSAGSRAGRRWVGVGVAAAAIVALGAGAVWVSRAMGSGGGPVELTSGRLTSFLGREHGASWSPDGNMLTFGHTLNGHSDIFVMSVPGGDPVQLTEHPADDDGPRWSPTGDRIAFISDRGTGLDVMVVAPTGGPVQKVASTNAPISEDPWMWFYGLGANPWSPDGETLLFSVRDSVGSAAVFALELGSGEQRQLTSPPAGVQDLGATWSEDGRRIAFSRGPFGGSEIWTMAADGSDLELLEDDHEWSFFPAWTSDGQGLVYIADFNLWTRRVPSGILGPLGTLLTGSPAGEPRPLTTGYNWIFSVDVGPEGHIAYSLTPHQTNLYEGVPGTPPDEHQQLSRDTNDQYGVRVSPDGRRVVYHSDRNGSMDIWVYDRQTGEHRPFTRGPAVDQMPDWLPDGRVVFASNRDAEEGPLWVASAEGGAPEPLADGLPLITCGGPYCRKGPNVSPDGGLVGFIGAGEDGETLWLVNADGSDPRPSGIRAAKSFDWFLDRRRVIYTTTLGDDSGRVQMRAHNLETGEDVLLIQRSATEPAVSPDGRSVAFLNAASHYNMNAFVLRLDPPDDPEGLPRAIGEPESIINGRGVWHVHNLDWTPDGEVVYTRDEDSGDIFELRPAG